MKSNRNVNLMEERPKVGIGALVLNGNKILLLKRKGSHGEGTWCYPGGHLEFNESIFDAAIREVREEAGIDVKNPRFLCITNDIFEKNKHYKEGKHYVTIFVVVDYVSGEARIMEKEKCADIGWFDLNNLPKPLFLSTENMINNKCLPENWKDNLKFRQ